MLKSIWQKITFLVGFTLSVSAKTTVGLIQIAEHPALDQTRQGIIDQLTKKLPGIEILWESAQANPAIASQIAQKYAGQEVTVIVAIGTPAAQAALNVCKDKDIPVVYASVTDPKAAKLQGNITGVSNYVDSRQILEKSKDTLPQLKTLGIIYNPGEANSERLVNLITQECEKQQIKLIPGPAYKTSDIAATTQSLISKVDAIIVDSDNTALSAIKNIVKIAQANGKPVITTDIDTIPQGVLLASGADQYQLGIQVANQVFQIIQGEQAQNIPQEGPEIVRFRLNQTSAKELKINIPQSIHQTAELWG